MDDQKVGVETEAEWGPKVEEFVDKFTGTPDEWEAACDGLEDRHGPAAVAKARELFAAKRATSTFAEMRKRREAEWAAKRQREAEEIAKAKEWAAKRQREREATEEAQAKAETRKKSGSFSGVAQCS